MRYEHLSKLYSGEVITVSELDRLQREFPDVYGPETWFFDKENMSAPEVVAALNTTDRFGISTPLCLFLDDTKVPYSLVDEYFGKQHFLETGVLVHAPNVGASTLLLKNQFFGSEAQNGVYPQGLGDRVNLLFLDQSIESPQHLIAFDRFRENLSSRRSNANPLHARIFSIAADQKIMASHAVIPFDSIGLAFQASSKARSKSNEISNATLMQQLLLHTSADYILAQQVQNGVADVPERAMDAATELDTALGGTTFSSLLNRQQVDMQDKILIHHTVLLCIAMLNNGYSTEEVLNKASIIELKLNQLS